jgi:hypothetical protein
VPGIVEAALVALWPLLAGAVAQGLSYAITAAAYYAFGTYQARSARRAATASFNDSLKDRLVMTATTDAPRSRVYGRVRNCDGILFKATHGTKKEYYTFVVAIAGHEIDAFEEYWFNDTELTLDGSGYVQTAPYAQTKRKSGSTIGSSTNATLSHTPVSGSVFVTYQALDGSGTISAAPTVVGTSVSYTTDGAAGTVVYQYDEGESKARVRGFTGAASQDISSHLIALGIADVTSAHKFSGIACLIVTLSFDTEAFAQGVPAMSAVVRGAKCYDPRTALTVWTRNPALIAADWATHAHGGGASYSEIVESVLIASANACDVVTPFDDAGPSGSDLSEPAYVCDLVAPTLTDPTQTLNEIVTAMAGKYAWAGGLLRIKAGAYTAPVVTITEDWLSGKESIDIVSGVQRQDLVNIYRPSIADAAQGYVVAPIEPIRAEAYITADGQELPRDLTLLAVTDAHHAQHVCSTMLKDARQALTLKLPCNLRAYPIEIFDTVAVTLERFGWGAKEFEVLSWSFTPNSGVVLTMKETDASIWDPAVSFTASDAAPNTSLPLPWEVPRPTITSIVSGTTPLTDGSVLTRVKVTWAATIMEGVRQSGRHEVQYALLDDIASGAVGEDDWQSTGATGDATFVVIPGLLAGAAWVFRVRAMNSLGIRSAWSTQSLHIVARPRAIVTTTYDETAPANPEEGDLWAKPSTGQISRWDAVAGEWVPFGNLYATTDVELVVTGGAVLTGGNSVEKSGGASAWDSQAYSKESYTSGAFAQATAVSNSHDVMFGLNTDPTTDAGFVSLDAAVYLRSDGYYDVYENAVSATGTASYGTYAVGDVFTITYDDANIRYMRNGTIFRSVAAAAGTKYFFDSSFLPDAELRGIRFGPMSSNNWGSIGGVDVTTDQIHADAATKVNQDIHDFAGSGFGTTTARTYSVTPTKNCIIEFTAKITGTNLLGDGGQSVSWWVQPAAGALSYLGGSQTNQVTKAEVTGANSFVATAGVQLDFTIKVQAPSATVNLYQSFMRVTEIKR